MLSKHDPEEALGSVQSGSRRVGEGSTPFAKTSTRFRPVFRYSRKVAQRLSTNVKNKRPLDVSGHGSSQA